MNETKLTQTGYHKEQCKLYTIFRFPQRNPNQILLRKELLFFSCEPIFKWLTPILQIYLYLMYDQLNYVWTLRMIKNMWAINYVIKVKFIISLIFSVSFCKT
jgi:hypothetical protein